MKFQHRISILTCDGTALEEHDNWRRVSPHCRVLMHGRLVSGVWGMVMRCVRSSGLLAHQKELLLVRFNENSFLPYNWERLSMDTRGYFREQNGMGRPSPPVAPAQAPVPVVAPPRLTKSQKRRLSSVMLFLRLKSQLGKVIGTPC